jgi:hypothetical protein
LRAEDFLAVDLRAVVFLATGLRAAVFLAELFFRVAAFLAVAI